MNHRTSICWVEWQQTSWVLSDKRIRQRTPPNLKENLHSEQWYDLQSLMALNARMCMKNWGKSNNSRVENVLHVSWRHKVRSHQKSDWGKNERKVWFAKRYSRDETNLCERNYFNRQCLLDIPQMRIWGIPKHSRSKLQTRYQWETCPTIITNNLTLSEETKNQVSRRQKKLSEENEDPVSRTTFDFMHQQ